MPKITRMAGGPSLPESSGISLYRLADLGSELAGAPSLQIFPCNRLPHKQISKGNVWRVPIGRCMIHTPALLASSLDLFCLQIMSQLFNSTLLFPTQVSRLCKVHWARQLGIGSTPFIWLWSGSQAASYTSLAQVSYCAWLRNPCRTT